MGQFSDNLGTGQFLLHFNNEKIVQFLPRPQNAKKFKSRHIPYHDLLLIDISLIQQINILETLT